MSIPGRGNTSKKPDGKPQGQVVSFTRGAADRIAKVVRTVERGDTSAEGLRFGRPAGGEGGKVFRICTFTGSWDIDAAKTVTFKNQTTTPNTVTAYNLHLGLEPASACDVLIGKAGTAWYLVQADLTKQPNYSGIAGTQVFSIASGTMEWADVESCPTEEASPTSLSLFFGS